MQPSRRFPTLRLLVPLAAFIAGGFLLGGIGLAVLRVGGGLLAGTPFHGLWTGGEAVVWAIVGAVTTAAVGEVLELLLQLAEVNGSDPSARRGGPGSTSGD
jgi:hypothetical protein